MAAPTGLIRARGRHWWAAAQHEQHRLTAGSQAEANDIVHDMVQLVSLLCTHAAWWQNNSLETGQSPR